ncbi:MAG: NAD(P)/FAD-dependent oxidoreductase [Burkholderiaceae bacterium]
MTQADFPPGPGPGNGTPSDWPAEVDIAIVGAGFSGMYMLYRARAMQMRAIVLEAGDGVGGTWYWNRYPGARVDIESLEYSYEFSEQLQQDWQWSERFAPQPELLRYANHVADRFELRRDIRFQCQVSSAHWQEAGHRWLVTTADGRRLSAQYLVMATGCLSSTNRPVIEGLDSFAGECHHTGRWPHEPVSFAGKRVGVIGTGSSAIQAIPVIARDAASLTVFQRTANYTVPAHNRPLDKAYEARIKAEYPAFRARNQQMHNAFGSGQPRHDQSALAVTPEAREAAYEARWQIGGLGFLGAFNDLMIDERANATAAEFVRNKIRRIVKDPVTAELLCPTQPIGCKRICVDSGYWATFNEPHVHLVDIAGQGIERVTPNGVVVGGQLHPLDMLVLATGFDAMTGTLLRMDIRGVDGLPLQQKWSAGPLTYLGLGVAGFPNLFTISGPGSPSVLTNMLVSLQQHVDWVADCVAHLRAQGKTRIEADPHAERDWVRHVNAVADKTLYPGCNSWYLGANVPGKTRVFMPLIGYPAYRDTCAEVAQGGYTGFRLGA